jgi:hypothetical protein
MATVNNATGLYTILGYNFDDPNGYVQEMSTDTQSHMNSMPAFITEWQATDIKNSDVGGYYYNSVAAVTQSIWNTANSIINLTLTTTFTNAPGVPVYATAVTLKATSNTFMIHTNRISNIEPFTGLVEDQPFYLTALNYGRMALYITNQTDGISNTSPIMGSFTSLLVKPQLTANSNIISTYITLIQNSLTEIVDPETLLTSNTSSLTLTQVNQIYSDLANTNNLMAGRRNADVTYYNNLKNFVNNYNTTKTISNMSETEKYLATNFIGTAKLITRINS